MFLLCDMMAVSNGVALLISNSFEASRLRLLKVLNFITVSLRVLVQVGRAVPAQLCFRKPQAGCDDLCFKDHLSSFLPCFGFVGVIGHLSDDDHLQALPES